MTYDSALKKAVVSELSQLLEMRGSLPTSVVTAMAENIECHPSTIRGWVASANGHAPSPNGSVRKLHPAELTDDQIQVIFQFQGDIRKAKRALDETDPDIAAMSESTFRRRWKKVDPAVRAMAAEGADGLLANQLRLVFEADRRNEIWHIDSMECPVRVLPAGHTTGWTKPWMITIIDAASRRIMAGLVTMERPNAETVVVALADAMRMRPLSVDGEYAGGVPEMVWSDNGAEFKNRLIKQGMTRLGIARKNSMPHMKNQNGKVERVQRTIQDSLMKQLPGYTDGPRTLSRRDPFGEDSQMLGEEAFVEMVYDYLEEYNSSHRHSSLGGRTPNQVWCDDDTPLQPVEPEALRLSLLEERRSYKVHPKGIHFRNVWYTALELAPHVGSKVEVRYMPRDPSFIEVFSEGDWVCTGYPNINLPESEREKFREKTRRQYLDARAWTTDASEERKRAALENPGEVIVTEDSTVGPPSGEMIANEAALLALGEDPHPGADAYPEAEPDLEPDPEPDSEPDDREEPRDE